MLTYNWIETGNSPLDRYVGDNLIVRYYVDEETEASLAFTPAMAAGSTVGLEGAEYYARNASDGQPCGPRPPHTAGPCTCGMDLLDGWPWETKWFGKGGAASSWISHLRVPFSRSLRITAQVACGSSDEACATVPAEFRRPDITSEMTARALVMFRGMEGMESELGIDLGFGALRLPPITSRRLRLRLERRTTANVSAAQLVQLAGLEDEKLDGAVLMLTVGFDGMRGKWNNRRRLKRLLACDCCIFFFVSGPLDIEGCWWAVVDKGATIRPGNTTEDLSSALLLGTGVEDLFGNAFGLSARNESSAALSF